MNWARGDRLPLDWHGIDFRLAQIEKLLTSGLESDFDGLTLGGHCIGFGFVLDSHRIGTGLAPDWFKME